MSIGKGDNIHKMENPLHNQDTNDHSYSIKYGLSHLNGRQLMSALIHVVIKCENWTGNVKRRIDQISQVV